MSNIDNASLPLSLEKLGTGFDVTITAEDVGAYKPDLRHFAKAISAFGGLGVPVGRILHVAQSLRADVTPGNRLGLRSEEHTSELQSLMRNSYAVFCLKKKTKHTASLQI